MPCSTRASRSARRADVAEGGGRSQERRRVRPTVSVLLALLLAMTMGGCTDPAAAARGSCRAQGVGELRCRAIVADAAVRVAPDAAPVVGVEVRMASPADRTTLRSQLLVAVVRFGFLDGSAQEVEVFCSPRVAATPVCLENEP